MKMRRAFVINISVLLVGFGLLDFNFKAIACQRAAPFDPVVMIGKADVIVRAIAVKYLEPPAGDLRTTGQPESKIEFKVEETLKGKDVPKILLINGYLSDKDDFNDVAVPYHFVRPGGRGGSCFANTYKTGGSFLLILRKTNSGYTPYWDALMPTNEQLRSSEDPWLLWVTGQLPHPKEPERKIGQSTSESNDFSVSIWWKYFSYLLAIAL
jgi:hypothetical protein